MTPRDAHVLLRLSRFIKMWRVGRFLLRATGVKYIKNQPNTTKRQEIGLGTVLQQANTPKSIFSLISMFLHVLLAKKKLSLPLSKLFQ